MRSLRIRPTRASAAIASKSLRQRGFSFCLAAVMAGSVLAGAPPSPQHRGDREVLFNEALARLQDGDLRAAEGGFRSLVQANPRDLDSRHYLGLILSYRGDTAGAIEQFNEVLDADPTFPLPRAARASANIRGGRFEAAEADLQALEADPQTRPRATRLRAQILYEQGRYVEAAQAFETARRAGAEEEPDAAVMEGLAYYRAGDVERSRAALERAQGLTPDPALAAARRQLESATGARRGRRPLQFDLSAGYEYDSNVALIEQGVTLPSDISRRGDARFVLEPRLRWNAVRTDRLTAGLSTSNYLSFQDQLTDFNVTSLQGGPFVNYQVSENVLAGLRYDFNYVEVGHEPYLRRNVVTPEVTLFHPGFGYTGLFLQYDARQYESIAGEGSLNRDGWVGALGAIQGIELPELFQGRGKAELQLSARLRHQEARGSDFDGTLLDGGATLFVPLPWKLTWDVGVYGGFDDYRRPNSLDIDRDPRRDVELSVSTGLTRQINEWTSVRIEYVYTNHDSNVRTADDFGPYDFSSHLVGFRLLFSY